MLRIKRSSRIGKWILSVTVVWAFSAGIQEALAALGETESSVMADRERSAGSHSVRTLPGGIRMHEITTPGGYYREFSGQDKTIFAITWRGRKPDHLSALLGSYGQEYINAIRTFRTAPMKMGQRHRMLETVTDHLLITGTGHPRDLRGMVEIQGKVPPGFDPENIPPP